MDVWGSVRVGKSEIMTWKCPGWYLKMQCLKLVIKRLQFNDSEKAQVIFVKLRLKKVQKVT